MLARLVLTTCIYKQTESVVHLSSPVIENVVTGHEIMQKLCICYVFSSMTKICIT